MSNSCFWILGRGASIANGLRWTVPKKWYADLEKGRASREEVFVRIKEALNHKMDNTVINGEAYRRLITELSQKTSDGWYHRFLTTNWDTLLERELYPFVRAEGVVPVWLGQQSHVFHLNGTIEEGVNEHRSPFLLEVDPAELRVRTVEANKALCQLVWSKCIVAVGISFACRTDQSFLAFLNRVEADMPVGEAMIYIVNPDRLDLDNVCNGINRALPASEIIPIKERFDSFIEDGLGKLIGTALTA